jgi:hypothetical protein
MDQFVGQLVVLLSMQHFVLSLHLLSIFMPKKTMGVSERRIRKD